MSCVCLREDIIPFYEATRRYVCLVWDVFIRHSVDIYLTLYKVDGLQDQGSIDIFKYGEEVVV